MWSCFRLGDLFVIYNGVLVILFLFLQCYVYLDAKKRYDNAVSGD